jgi:hypothetical protein
MNGAQSYLAIFDETSMAAESEVFWISPGWVGVLRAFGFAELPVTVDPDKPKVRQRACLNQLVVRAWDWPEDGTPCGVYRDSREFPLIVEAEGPVKTDGCPWQLSACRTVGLISLPGAYRLVLNDPAAAGTARVYMKAYLDAPVIRDAAPRLGE